MEVFYNLDFDHIKSELKNDDRDKSLESRVDLLNTIVFGEIMILDGSSIKIIKEALLVLHYNLFFGLVDLHKGEKEKIYCFAKEQENAYFITCSVSDDGKVIVEVDNEVFGKCSLNTFVCQVKDSFIRLLKDVKKLHPSISKNSSFNDIETEIKNVLPS